MPSLFLWGSSDVDDSAKSTPFGVFALCTE
jgi:hypothetical protein